jgi:ATP-dependent DNA helicase DinG
MNNVFGREGCLNDILPFYEYRDQQYQMASFLQDFFTDGGVSFVEAGTGTGKSLAYLVPALEYCIREDKVLAVSTETKTLQKQLFDKDIPLVEEIFRKQYDTEFKYSLCLGSANYPCIKRFEIMLQRGGYLFEEQEEISRIADMIEKGETFSRYDVRVSAGVWHEIERDSDTCRGNDCPDFQRCVFQRVKKEWFSSRLLIMNHYLFFSNAATGYTYLPKTDLIIFDEAHSIENIASKQLGFEISYPILMDILDRFHHPNKKLLLPLITNKSASQTARSLFSEIIKAGKAYFDSLAAQDFSRKRSIRIRKPVSEGVLLSNLIDEFLSVLKESENDFKEEPSATEYESARAKLTGFLDGVNQSVKSHPENMVLWCEKNDQDTVSLCGSPVEVSQIMAEKVYPQFESTSFVSATLSIGGDFSYIAGRLGAEDPKVLSLDSPFDYSSRVCLYIPSDIPTPQERGFIDAAVQRTAELIDLTGGNTLVLFTSYEMLREFETRLRQMLNVDIFSQDGGDAARVVADYMESPGAVLLGTHSFWQGLDLPGDLLRCVIITKLPFPVPDRPDIEAKSEVIEAKGDNPFVKLHIPMAVIQLKQGFGRLMRRIDDKGMVAILDNRVITKMYGRNFILSLPKCINASTMKNAERFVEKILGFR